MMTKTAWKRCLDVFPDLLSMYGSTEAVVAGQARGKNSYEEKLGNTGYPSTLNEVKIGMSTCVIEGVQGSCIKIPIIFLV